MHREKKIAEALQALTASWGRRNDAGPALGMVFRRANKPIYVGDRTRM
jgi:hypothetical protein